MAPAIPGLDACFSPFSGTTSTDIQVPIVRIFGSLTSGQSCCVHLHRLFPYFYVPYPPSLPTDASEAAMKLKQMAIGLETAMHALSMAKKTNGGVSKQTYIQNLQVVKAKNMYGYHASDELFVKVSLFRPGDVERAATLLGTGSVLGVRFSPAFEAHVPFILQVMMDLNLRGMGEIDLKSILLRDPLPTASSSNGGGRWHRPGWRRQGQGQRQGPFFEVRYEDESTQLDPQPSTASPLSSLPLHSSNCPRSIRWSFSPNYRNAPKRQAPGCDLEADACAEEVLNRSKAIRVPLDEAGPEMQLLDSLKPMWEEERGRCEGGTLPPRPDSPPRHPPQRPLLPTVVQSMEEKMMCNLEARRMKLEVLSNQSNRPSAPSPSPPPSLPHQPSPTFAQPEAAGPLSAHTTPAHMNERGVTTDRFHLALYSQCANEMVAGTPLPSQPSHSQHESLSGGRLTQLADLLGTCQPMASNMTTPIRQPSSSAPRGALRLSDVAEIGPTPLLTGQGQHLTSFGLDSPFVMDQGSVLLLPSKVQINQAGEQAAASQPGSVDLPYVDHRILTQIIASQSQEPEIMHPAAFDQEQEEEDGEEEELLPTQEQIVQDDLMPAGDEPIEMDDDKDSDHGASRMEIESDGCEEAEERDEISDDEDDDEMMQTPHTHQSQQQRSQRAAGASPSFGPLPLVVTSPSTSGPHSSPVTRSSGRRRRRSPSFSFQIPQSDGASDDAQGKSNDDKAFSFQTSSSSALLGPGSHLPPSLVRPFKPLWPQNMLLNPDGSDAAKPGQLKRKRLGLTNILLGSGSSEPQDQPEAIKIGTASNANADQPPEEEHDPIVFDGSDAESSSSESREVEMKDRLPMWDILQDQDPQSQSEDQHQDIQSSLPVPQYPQPHSIPEQIVIDTSPSPPPASLVSNHARFCFRPSLPPPSPHEALATIQSPVVHQEIFYSVPSDAPLRPLVFAGREFKIPTSLDIPSFTREFDGQSCETSMRTLRLVISASMPPPSLPSSSLSLGTMRPRGMAFTPCALQAPTCMEIDEWLAMEGGKGAGSDKDPMRPLPQVEGYVEGEGRGSELLLTPILPSSAGQASMRASLEGKGRSSLRDDDNVPPASPKWKERNALAHRLSDADICLDAPRAIELIDRDFEATGDGKGSGPPSSFKGTATIRTQGPGALPFSLLSPHKPGTKTATPPSQRGFRVGDDEGEGLVLLAVEIVSDCSPRKLPNPQYDAVMSIVMFVAGPDGSSNKEEGVTPRIFILNQIDNPSGLDHVSDGTWSGDALRGFQIDLFCSELAMIEAFAAAIVSLDPDVIVGWEVQRSSIGYLAERSSVLNFNLLRRMSRTPDVQGSKEYLDDEYGRDHAAGLHSTGRVLLSLWRMMRSEVNLRIYTIERCAAAVLRERVPSISQGQLAAWFKGGPSGGRWRALSHTALRCRLSIDLLYELDLLGRTAEMSRTYGIDFYSCLTRGSQYRVEAVMLRLAHSQNYLAPSPIKEEIGSQPALEVQPLILEPESRMYVDPVIILDFQSLYPSLVIAYNLCFTTCIGRPEHAMASPSDPIRLGCFKYSTPDLHLPSNQDSSSPDSLPFAMAPNGVAYLQSSQRKGVLPRMLKEILDTRLMVKGAMRRCGKGEKALKRVLDARQYGLKMLANTTYGYASASFSGRMPFAELADSIVESGRQTLYNAIELVNNGPWGAKVVYGDTDSLFVLMKGRSREDAFKIGAEIAAAVTESNPAPVTLRMDKVYHPCILQTKKRYCGYMYENPGQVTPTFDAKGIETVRRDGCPAVSKLLEHSLRILFESKDLSATKSYLQQQLAKILTNRVSLSDFIFAKEVKIHHYKNQSTMPPGASVASKAMQHDTRTEPLYNERVPFIIVHGEIGSTLREQAVTPWEMIESMGRMRLNSTYYINKQIIPALDRMLSLIGADVKAWYDEMPKAMRMPPQKRPAASLGLSSLSRDNNRQMILEDFFSSKHCCVCDEPHTTMIGRTSKPSPLCHKCLSDPASSYAIIQQRSAQIERQHRHMVRICLHCGGGGGGNIEDGAIVCNSLDCEVYFSRVKLVHEMRVTRVLTDECGALL